jgi:hypothetical protein
MLDLIPMLVIREAQFATFRAQREDDFRKRLRQYLKRALPEGRFTDSELDGHVRAGVDQALDCGLAREADAAQFVEAICVHLDGFPAEGLPKQVLPGLYAYGVDPKLKLERFMEWCKTQGASAKTSWQTNSDRNR